MRYADDFVVIANSKGILENKVLPKLRTFLETRGLNLNTIKTKIIHRTEGFNFLGFHIKFLIKPKAFTSFLYISPPKKKISKLMRKIKGILKTMLHRPLNEVIVELNWVIRGWAYYYRFSNAAKAFAYLEHLIIQAVWRTLRRRHNNFFFYFFFIQFKSPFLFMCNHF